MLLKRVPHGDNTCAALLRLHVAQDATFEHATQVQTLFNLGRVTCRALQDDSPSALDLPSMYMNDAYLDSLEEPLPAELPEVDDTMSLGDVSVGDAPDMERLGPSESSDSVF